MEKWFEGENVSLRALEPEDLALLYTLENDTNLWFLTSTSVPYSRYLLKQYIAENAHDIYVDGQLRLIIEEKNSRKAIGMVDLFNYDIHHRRAEVGIILLEEYRSQGFASEALSLLETYSVVFLALKQLYAFVCVKNTASIKLFQAQGYLLKSSLLSWIRIGNSYEDVAVLQKIFDKI